MSSSVADPPEGFNYGGKYGWVNQDTKSFDDLLDTFKTKYYLNKLVKLKIWSGKKDESIVVYGIQAFYKNINTGKITETKEYRGDGFDKVEEFEIGPDEYLNKFHVRIDTEVTQVGFETNKGKSIVVGGTKGEDKYVRLNEGNNIIISLYGNYNKYLEAIGVGYVNREWYMKRMCFGYFQLRFKFKKDDNFKKEWMDKINNLDTYQKAMIKSCSLPDSAFTEIIKFCV